jgi:hypothetical protein
MVYLAHLDAKRASSESTNSERANSACEVRDGQQPAKSDERASSRAGKRQRATSEVDGEPKRATLQVDGKSMQTNGAPREGSTTTKIKYDMPTRNGKGSVYKLNGRGNLLGKSGNRVGVKANAKQ